MANEYKCDICGKPATVHITKIIESKKVKIHLCSECAEKMSMDALEIPEQIMPKIKELEEQLIKDVSKASKSGVCPTCETSFADVEKGSRFGCPDCYETFSDKLPEFLAQMQFGSVHVGKSPKKHADSHTLNPLELLGKAIEQVGKIFGIENKAAEEGQPAESAQPESGPQAAQEVEQAKQEDDAESIDVLRAKLDEAIREERYEDAAKLRDRINSLSK